MRPALAAPLRALSILGFALAALAAGCGDSGSNAGDTGTADTADTSGADGAAADGADGAEGADAAGDAGDDAAGTSDAEGDGMGDGTGGGFDWAAHATEFCAVVCQGIPGRCAVEIAGGAFAGFDATACEAECAARIGEDHRWLSNYTCVRSACDEACLGDAPTPTDTRCEAGCAALDTCGATDQLPGFTIGAAEHCAARCTGLSQADGDWGTAFGCLGQSEPPACAQAALDLCFEILAPTPCESACSQIHGPGGCDAGAPAHGVWPTMDACLTACAALPDATAVSMFRGCVFARGCADPTPCTALPSAIEPACATSCAAFRGICGSDATDTLAEGFCEPFCTGHLVHYVEGPSADAQGCVDGFGGQCPEPQDHPGTMLGCAVTQPVECAPICGGVTQACLLDPLDTTACEGSCAIYDAYGPHDTLAPVAACMAGVDFEADSACLDAVECLPDID